MESKEQREVRLLLRDNRVKRQQLNKILESLRADVSKLLEERTKLLERAENSGMNIKKKAMPS